MNEYSYGSLSLLARRLKEARKGVKLSTRDVAERLPVKFKLSHATIANYEKDRTTPDPDVVAALAQLYGRPVAWFASPGLMLSGIRYRNLKSKVRVGDKEWFQSESQRWLEAYIRLEKHLNKPLVREISPKICPTQTDESLAQELRAELGFDNEQPIPSVIECLERLGVRAIEIPTELPIDGMAARIGHEYAIVLNANTSNDRCRIDAAHEK